MTLVYILKLGFQVCQTNIRAQKIDGSIFETFRMVLTSFQVENKLEKAQSFQETILLANIHTEIIFEILFLIFNNANMSFLKQKFIKKFYTTAEPLPTTKQVKFINKKIC